MNPKKIYKNPEVNIIDIEAASIIATSGSAKPCTASKTRRTKS